MLPTKVYLLSNKGQLLNAKVVNCRQAAKQSHSYVIGFFDKRMAKLVCERIDLSRPVEIISSQPENISTEVNLGLQKFGIDRRVGGDLIIDVDAQLRLFYQHDRGSKDTMDVINLVVKDTSEFLLWPLELYLGVAMPMAEIFAEDDERSMWSVPCQYIEPCMDFEKFKASLKI